MQALNQGKSVEFFRSPRFGHFCGVGFGVASRFSFLKWESRRRFVPDGSGLEREQPNEAVLSDGDIPSCRLWGLILGRTVHRRDGEEWKKVTRVCIHAKQA